MAHGVSIFAAHLTFTELGVLFDQGKATSDDVMPCACWHAGYGDIRGLHADQVQHPDEFRTGAQAAFEQSYDC